MRPFLFLFALSAAAILPLAASPAEAEVVEPEHPEASPYVELPEIAVTAQLMALRTVAIAQGKRMMVVFGANWCHDSRALAGTLETPRFKSLVERHFTLLYVDAGTPQEGDGRNMELAARLGVPDIEGTPNLLIIDPATGKLLNTPNDARSWRDAASRGEDDIYDDLAGFAAEGN